MKQIISVKWSEITLYSKDNYITHPPAGTSLEKGRVIWDKNNL